MHVNILAGFALMHVLCVGEGEKEHRIQAGEFEGQVPTQA